MYKITVTLMSRIEISNLQKKNCICILCLCTHNISSHVGQCEGLFTVFVLCVVPQIPQKYTQRKAFRHRHFRTRLHKCLIQTVQQYHQVCVQVNVRRCKRQEGGDRCSRITHVRSVSLARVVALTNLSTIAIKTPSYSRDSRKVTGLNKNTTPAIKLSYKPIK